MTYDKSYKLINIKMKIIYIKKFNDQLSIRKG